MKVILMQKVERLGDPGQQVDVADGYARNYLLPKQLAVPATAGRLKSLAQLTAQAKNREERARREAQSLGERLQAVQLTFRRRASEETALTPAPTLALIEGAAQPPETAQDVPPASTALLGPRLFGSVTSQDISEALLAQGLAVDKKKVLLPEPLKTLGVHRVPVRLHADVTAEVTVSVEREA
ncbi:MAG: 50S ribosomal protein L9 [Candidatus Methylomirabilales bacterium]